MSVTIILIDISRLFIAQDIDRASQAESRKVANLLSAYLKERMTALNLVANFFSNSDHVDEAEFRGFVKSAMREVSGITAIAVTDSQAQPLWVESDEAISSDLLTTLLRTPALVRATNRAMTSGRYVISDPVRMGDYGTGFVALIPYFEDAARQQLGGFVIGAFLHDRLVKNLLIPELVGDFNIRLHQWDIRMDSPLYQIATDEPAEKARAKYAGVEEDFFMGDQRWRVSVIPTGYPGSTRSYFSSGTILALGTTLAFLFSILLYRQQVVAAKSQSEAQHSRSRLASTSERLAQVREELDLILNNVDEEIILYDEDLAPLQANMRYRKAFHSAGREDDSLDLPSEEHHRLMASFFKNETQYWIMLNNLRENPERPFTDEIELRTDKADEGRRFYRRQATAVCAPDGSRRGYLVIYQDTTLPRALEKLKEDFLSSVTHDLRTPLASIQGFADTILRDPSMDIQTRNEFISIISKESIRLREMIEDLLDLRRLEEGKIDLSPATYHMRALIEDVVRSSRPVLEAREIEVKIDWEGPPGIPLVGDEIKIGRALRNILSNSVKYSPSGSTIWIRGTEAPDRVEVNFTDEGPGIPPNELQHVFEKFYRGSRHVRRTTGTGLGLAIVKHIIEGHGGVVSAANAPKRGTTIKVVLPREFEFGAEQAAVSPVRAA